MSLVLDEKESYWQAGAKGFFEWNADSTQNLNCCNYLFVSNLFWRHWWINFQNFFEFFVCAMRAPILWNQCAVCLKWNFDVKFLIHVIFWPQCKNVYAGTKMTLLLLQNELNKTAVCITGAMIILIQNCLPLIYRNIYYNAELLWQSLQCRSLSF